MSNKSKKKNPRILYSRETLKEALAAINAGMPINTASHKFHIPRSTLHSKKIGKYADKRPGPDTVLTAAEENSLVQWIMNCSKCGLFVSKPHLLNSVALMVKLLNRDNPFANGRPGRHWYQSFLRRHENVLVKMSENTLSARAAACETGIRRWFTIVKSYLEERKLLNIHPSRIFTTETVLLASPEANEDTENLSVQITGNAAGELAPPMIIYNYQRIPGKVYENLPQKWVCGKSENGCMTPETLFDYVTKCFHPWLVDKKIEFPVILFLDGRVPHLTLTLSDFCWKNKIELVALHPNASFVLQPLEVSLFPLLKVTWQETLTKYRLETKAINLVKEQIAPLLKSVFDILDVVKMLAEGFQESGLYPWSENVINYEKIPKKAVEKVSTERVEYTPYISELLAPLLPIEEPTEKSSFIPEFLQSIEQLIDPDTLQAFKSVRECDEWTGKLEDTGLFYFWRKVVNACKTDHIKSEQNTVTLVYDTDYVKNEETDIHSDLNENKDMEFVEDPLKLCITQMEET